VLRQIFQAELEEASQKMENKIREVVGMNSLLINESF
jgi:hypothetical protein